MEIIIGFIILIYALDILLLFYYGLHCYVMVYLYKKNHKHCDSQQLDYKALEKQMGAWPVVTVQLPMFNEFYVAERIIEATAAIDYPKSKLEIQVLDDSTDESRFVAERKVKELKKKGYDIKYIHRENREGHKAGALRDALDEARGRYIAIFDADFLPSKDFLRKAIPAFFSDAKMGMVQARWGHINADYSMLTRAQSIGIDGHFMIEQVARNGSNLWMNFNGTAGVWLKDCIVDAGNWTADTLTEDFDLSYRAELNGWKFHYISDVVNPAEIPATVPAYKTQQFRWCKGSIQCAVKLIPRILKSNENWKVKAEAITHLTNYSVHPLMIINILATLPLLLFHDVFMNLSMTALFGAAFFLSIGTLGPMIFYFVSQKALYPEDWKRRVTMLPLLTTIGTGIAINNTRAWIEAVMGKKSGFVRTPKLKLESKNDKALERAKYNTVKIDKTAFLELAMGLYIVLTIIVGIMVDKWFVLPFLFLYAGGFFYVSFFTIYDALKQGQFSRKAAAKEARV